MNFRQFKYSNLNLYKTFIYAVRLIYRFMIHFSFIPLTFWISKNSWLFFLEYVTFPFTACNLCKTDTSSFLFHTPRNRMQRKLFPQNSVFWEKFTLPLLSSPLKHLLEVLLSSVNHCFLNNDLLSCNPSLGYFIFFKIFSSLFVVSHC